MTPAARLRRAIAANLAKGRALEEAEVAAHRAILQQTRREILADLATRAPGSSAAALRGQILTSIDTAMLRGSQAAGRAMAVSTGLALRIGQDRVAASLTGLGADASIGALHGTSSALLSAIHDVTSDQVRAVWSELGTTLKATVRRAALGTVLPHDAQRAITAAIQDPKVFGKAALRAEAIVRTELNRTFSLAADERIRSMNERLGGTLRKVWIVSADARTRESHLEAGRRYAPGGDPGPIPIDQPFEVGDARLMMPQDPSGPAGEVINCRCALAPYVEPATR